MKCVYICQNKCSGIQERVRTQLAFAMFNRFEIPDRIGNLNMITFLNVKIYDKRYSFLSFRKGEFEFLLR